MNPYILILLLSSLTANYVLGNYNVKVNILGQGTVDGVGTFSNNTQVTLTAKPQSGYKFKGWSGDLTGSGEVITFSITSPISANAHFEPLSRNIVYINGRPALAGSFVAKLNENGRRRLQRRVNRVGDTLVYRRNKVLEDLVSIEWDSELKLKDNLNGQNLTNEEIQELAEKRSALKSQGVESQLKEMLNSGNYEYLQPNWLIKLEAIPTDLSLSDGTLWGISNVGQNGGTLGIDANVLKAWEISQGSEDVVIAVIDTGVRHTHQDLNDNMWVNPNEIPANGIDDDNNGYVDDIHGIDAILESGNPMDYDGHGTHVAGTISAVADSKGKVIGVAPGCKIMALRFIDEYGSTEDQIECIDYAIANGAKVINASYGWYGYNDAYNYVFKNGDSVERAAIAKAQDAGIVFVAAAGNGYHGSDGQYYGPQDTDRIPHFPSSYNLENIISVAAIDRHGRKASFSEYGIQSVDLGAPGVSILSTWHTSNASYRSIQGTSMAAPHVAGAAALLLSIEPSLTPSQVRKRLIDTAKPLQSLQGITVSGGMLDVHASLAASPRSILSLDVTYSPEIPDKGGEMTITARLTSPQPVLGASVQVTLGENFSLLDNGFNGDEKAMDGIYSAKVFAPNLLTFDLLVTASASGFEPVSKTIPVKTIFRPQNDSFAQALSLSTSKNLTTGDNSGATVEPEEDLFSPGVSGTMWYSWRPSRAGDATLTTFGSAFDTSLAVYQGESFGNLQRIAANDDFNKQQTTSKIEFNAEKDQLYWLQVGGMNGAVGPFKIHHPQPKESKPPSPVIFPPVITTKAQDLTKTEGEVISLSVDALGTPPLSYQWVLNGGKILGADQSSFSTSVLALEDSGQYSVIVSNQAGMASADIANLKVRPSQNPPLNDDIENAAILEGTRGSGIAITRMATGQPNEPDHAGVSNPLHSVWWKWTAPKSGTVRVSTDGSSFDTSLAAYLLNETEDSRRSKEIGKIITSFTPASVSKNLSIQLPGHGFSDGQVVEITGLLGHSSQNGKFLINRIDAGSFSLSGTAGLSNLSLSPASRVTPLK